MTYDNRPSSQEPGQAQPHPIEDAVGWAMKLRTIASRLGERPARSRASNVVTRIAETIEHAVELQRTNSLDEESALRLDELLDRLDESTWNGTSSTTKNDILRQASNGTFPPVAEHLTRAMTDEARERTALRSRRDRPEPGAIDLSGLDDR